MLKRRLRVFENISKFDNDCDNEEKIKIEAENKTKIYRVYSIIEEDKKPDLDLSSNTLILNLPSKLISEEDLFSILNFYGEIEQLNSNMDESQSQSLGNLHSLGQKEKEKITR